MQRYQAFTGYSGPNGYTINLTTHDHVSPDCR